MSEENVQQVFGMDEFAEFVVAEKPETLEVFPKRLVCRVGSVSINLNERGFGTVEVNGVSLRVKSLKIEATPGHVPIVILEIVPIPRAK